MWIPSPCPSFTMNGEACMRGESFLNTLSLVKCGICLVCLLLTLRAATPNPIFDDFCNWKKKQIKLTGCLEAADFIQISRCVCGSGAEQGSGERWPWERLGWMGPRGCRHGGGQGSGLALSSPCLVTLAASHNLVSVLSCQMRKTVPLWSLELEEVAFV